MRQTISGLVAAFAVLVAGAAPAMACRGGLFQGSCSPCGQAYVEPCAQLQLYQPPVYVPPAPVYSGCNTCGGGWGYERLVEPETQYYAAPMQHQYYYVNQGPTYTGPGDLAPRPTYHEGGYGYRAHPYYRPYHHGYGYSTHPGYRYGYAHHSMRYGMPHHFYGYREHALRRYY
jgi:hypothetical protein